MTKDHPHKPLKNCGCQSTKNVVVTGVSSGIGEAITRYLLLDGYRVFGSIRKQEDAERLQDSLGSMFVPLLFDLRDNEAIKRSALLVSKKLDGYPLTALSKPTKLSGTRLRQ